MKKENSKKDEEVIDNVDETLAKETKEEKASETKIGTLLKEMRTKQGKTFEEISQDLCIRKAYLSAIEEGDYNNIPEYPYGIGFIRSYADYLGLDGNQIVQMYKSEAEADFRKKHPYYVMEPQQEATVPSKKYVLSSLILLVVLYAAWNMYNQFAKEQAKVDTTNQEVTVIATEENDFPLKIEDYSNNIQEEAPQEAVVQEEKVVEEAPVKKENKEVKKEEKKEVKKEKKENKKEEKLPVVDLSSEENQVAQQQVVVTEKSFVEPKAETDVEAEAEEAEVEDAPGKSNLTIKLLKDTWIEVRNDKKLYISKVLYAGDSYTLPKDTNLRLSVGKAEGVEILYNGQKAYEVAPNKKMNISVDEIIANAQN